MKLPYEVWEALSKFFMSISQGLILAGIVSYILESKNLFVSIAVVILGLVSMGYGLYFTSLSVEVKERR